MPKTNQEFPPKASFLQIKQDDKFFARLLSKETSFSNPSFRVYYNGSVPVAVPFLWESEPGTPKHPFHDTALPPLTPPPSYFCHAVAKNSTKKHCSWRSSLLHTLFSRIICRKSSRVFSPAPSSSSLSTSNCSFGTPEERRSERRRCSSRGSSIDYWKRCEDDEVVSPTSTLCFSLRRVSSRHSGSS